LETYSSLTVCKRKQYQNNTNLLQQICSKILPLIQYNNHNENSSDIPNAMPCRSAAALCCHTKINRFNKSSVLTRSVSAHVKYRLHSCQPGR